jgi:isoleucyl-tRNA synthetase
MTPELEAEGYSRELARKVQASRKKAGLKKENRISLVIDADPGMQKMLESQEKSLKERTNAENIEFRKIEKKESFKSISPESIKNKKINVAFDVL